MQDWTRYAKHAFLQPELTLSNKAELTLSSQLGLLRIRLVVISEISYASINIRNVGTETRGHGNGRVSKLMGFTGRAGGFVFSQLDNNGNLYSDIGDLLQKLDVFSQIAGDIASVGFCSVT